jgi:hypothetical protein
VSLGIVGALLLAGTVAHADRELHGGLEVRTDLRAHPLRIPFGLRSDRLDTSIVLDPLVFMDGQHDGDLTVEWRRCAGAPTLLVGWRASTIALAGGHQWYESSLLGVTAQLGRRSWLSARFGAELAILWVKHGADLPTSWIGLDRSIVDRIRFGMFVRLEYASRF